jgi:hypothetical protein
MWLAFASVTILLTALPATADASRIFLECRGHDDVRGVQTEHEVAIFGDRAEIDGKRYRLAENQTEFTLTGPDPKYDRIMYINRLTGEWALTPSSLEGDSAGKLESSGKGEGCELTRRKF